MTKTAWNTYYLQTSQTLCRVFYGHAFMTSCLQSRRLGPREVKTAFPGPTAREAGRGNQMQATCVPATHLRFCWSFSVLMCQPRKLPGGWRSNGLKLAPSPGPPLHSTGLASGRLPRASRGCWAIGLCPLSPLPWYPSGFIKSLSEGWSVCPSEKL